MQIILYFVFVLLFLPFDVEPTDVACPASCMAEELFCVVVEPATFVSFVVVVVRCVLVVFDVVVTTEPHAVSNNSVDIIIAMFLLFIVLIFFDYNFQFSFLS